MLQVDPVVLLRAFFITCAATILLVNSIPSLRDRFIFYGPRAINNGDLGHEGQRDRGWVSYALDRLAMLRVPHDFFTTFYILSVLSTIFWLFQIFFRGYSFRVVTTHIDGNRPTMTTLQTWISLFLMFTQGSRRLIESIAFRTKSKSRIWVGHWVLGFAFYLAVGIGVWIEGAGELKRQTIHVELRNVQWEGPSAILTYFRYLLFALLFFKAAKHQHLVHKALYELRKRPRPDSPYAVPTGDSFKYTLTPHYFAEILIYLSLAFIAAPPGHWINGTLFYAVVFVATNLGVTAAGTRKWYEAKFGEQVVRGKAAMIPFIW